MPASQARPGWLGRLAAAALTLGASGAAFAQVQPAAPAMPSPSAHPFPAAELERYFADLEQFRTASPGASAEEQAVTREDLKRRLARLLPARRYAFGLTCPLLLRSSTDDALYYELELSCFSPALRERRAIRIYPAANEPAGRMLANVDRARELLGDLQLERAELRADLQVDWLFRPARLGYANPFLELLRVRYPAPAEAQLLTEARVNSYTRELLLELHVRSRDAEYLRRRSLIADFYAVAPPGAFLQFGAECPLRVEAAPRREAGAERSRLRLRITCLGGARLGAAELLLPPELEGDRSFLKLNVGEHLRARLQFSGIRLDGLQYRLAWDTIRDMERLSGR